MSAFCASQVLAVRSAEILRETPTVINEERTLPRVKFCVSKSTEAGIDGSDVFYARLTGLTGASLPSVFHAIVDVKNYKEFVPFCKASRCIRQRTCEDDEFARDNDYELSGGISFFKVAWCSRVRSRRGLVSADDTSDLGTDGETTRIEEQGGSANTFYDEEDIDGATVEAQLLPHRPRSPFVWRGVAAAVFRSLHARWRIDRVNEDSRVRFECWFSFRSPLITRLALYFFGTPAGDIIDEIAAFTLWHAFEERAFQLDEETPMLPAE
ncbi:MAG: hypothetical protein MHM6MM_001995 [Cercozoa sp. M6MM]